MVRPSYLYRRGARYYFRIRIPGHLAATIGRREIRLSLRTADFKTARRRALRMAAAFLTTIESPDLMPKNRLPPAGKRI